MTVQKLVNNVFQAGLFVMLVTLVASLGLSFSVKQIIAPLRRVWVVVAALVINVLVVPAVGWGICKLFPLSKAELIGIVLCISASAGPAGLKAAQLAKRADMALAVSLVIVLQLANIVAAPLWAKAVVSGATVSPWLIIKDLLLLVLIPLVVGLILYARYTEHAAAWKAGLQKVSNIALYIAIVFGIAANWSVVKSQLGSWIIIVTVILTLIFAALGSLIGLKDRATAITGAMLTGMRFTPIGMIVIMTQLNGNPEYLAPTLVYSIVYTFLLFGIGAEIGRRATSSQRKAKESMTQSRPAPKAA